MLKIIVYLVNKVHNFKIPTNWLASEKTNTGFHNVPCSKHNLDWLICNHMTLHKFRMYTICYTILTGYQKLYPEQLH